MRIPYRPLLTLTHLRAEDLALPMDEQIPERIKTGVPIPLVDLRIVDGAGTITVATRADARHITVSVRDTGRGIPAEVLPHIFEAYFTTKPDGEGTGLGLAIARNIVEEHGGDIHVSSEVGVGSEFRVRLPIDKVT